MTASLSARKHALRLLILFLNLTAIVSIEESITGRFQYYREKSQFEYTLVILRGGSSASGTNTPLGGEKKNEQEDRQRMSKLDHDDIMEMLKRDRQAALQYLRGDDNPTHAPDSPDTSLSVDRDNNKGSSETMSPEINDNLQAEDDTQENISMNRATVEVYTLVSALISVTSFSMYDRLSQNWKGKQFLLVDTCNNLQCYLVIAVDVACLAASVLGMIAGLHSAFVFSLMTVYSRSAAAVGKKLAFDRFLEQTAGEQLRGLRSFRLSLYAFLVQCYFIIQRPLPRVLWQVATPILLFMGWNVYKDTQSIIKSAGKELLTTNDEKASISTVAVSTESESAKTENSPSQVEES